LSRSYKAESHGGDQTIARARATEPMPVEVSERTLQRVERIYRTTQRRAPTLLP
jgi:hypothetical protein